ncbi:hypothetical protein ACVW0I_005026 [Bradyrhizobium sp. LM6.11]
MSRRIKRTDPKPRSRDERKETRPFKARSAKTAGPRPGGKPGAKPPRFAAERIERRVSEPALEQAAPPKPVEALLPTKVETVKVTADENNMRVDRFLSKRAFPACRSPTSNASSAKVSCGSTASVSTARTGWRRARASAFRR